MRYLYILILGSVYFVNIPLAHAEACAKKCIQQYDENSAEASACVVGCDMARTDSDASSSSLIRSVSEYAPLGAGRTDRFVVSPCLLDRFLHPDLQQCETDVGMTEEVIFRTGETQNEAPVILTLPQGSDPCLALKQIGLITECPIPDGPGVGTSPLPVNPCTAGACPDPVGSEGYFILQFPTSESLE